MEVNTVDICKWIHNPLTKADKEGLLLVCKDDLRKFSTEFSNDSDDPVWPMTVKTKLVGNTFSFWDCTLDTSQLEDNLSCTFLLVLERTTVQLCDSTQSLPFPFSLTFLDYSFLRFSPFTDEERQEWLLKLSSASREVAQAQFDDLAEKLQIKTIESVKYDRSASNGLDEKITKSLLTSPCHRSQRFPLPTRQNGPIRQLCCEEWMYESKLTILLPVQMLKLFRRWAQDLRNELETRLVYLPSTWQDVKRMHIRQISANLEQYDQASEFLDAYSGPDFRPSADKSRVAFAFAPLNLHVQQFLINDNTPDRQSFQFITSGCCAAIPLRFQHGGLSRMTKNFDSDEMSNTVEVERFSSKKTTLIDVKRKLAQLTGDVERNWTTEQHRFRDGQAGFSLLADLKQLRAIVQDWATSFPGISTTLETLSGFGQSIPSTRSNSDSFIPVDELEPQLDTLDALLISLTTKIAAYDTVDQQKAEGLSFGQWMDNARSIANRCLDCLSRLTDSLLDSQLFRLFHHLHTAADISLHYHQQLRMDIVFSQALSIICTSLLSRLLLTPSSDSLHFCHFWPSSGPMFTICSFLSCYGDERGMSIAHCPLPIAHCPLPIAHCPLSGMLEDMLCCWRPISRSVRFRFVSSFSSVVQTIVPSIDGHRSQLLVTLPLPEDVFRRLPSSLIEGAHFCVFPVFWNVGINHEASFVQTLGDSSVEKRINVQAFNDTESYLHLYRRTNSTCDNSTIERIATELGQMVESCPSNKNVHLLKLALILTRTVSGLTMISCKSGKDRTAMGVTLEEGRLLRENCGVSEQQMWQMITVLRRDGVRLENCWKNVRKRLYSFSPLQLHFLPKEFRPPDGTFGHNVQN